MAKKDFTIASKILISLLAFGDAVLVTSQELRKRSLRGQLLGDSRSMSSFLYYLYKKGYIRYVDKDNERFIKITKAGELKVLLEKSKLENKHPVWDGKWRIIIFDIPEESKEKRHFFRALLKQNGYVKLQGSVYINPYPLNREAIGYLKETGLNKFIRIIKAEEIDDDRDLKKEFNLK